MECNQIIYEFFAYAQVEFLDKSAGPKWQFSAKRKLILRSFLLLGKTHLACIRDWHKWLSDFANRLDEMRLLAISLENASAAREEGGFSFFFFYT